jgi:hypothetical protein
MQQRPNTVSRDMLRPSIIKNTNLFTKEANLELCGDNTSWAHGGYGESNSGIVFRVTDTPCVTRDSQTVITTNHKLHEMLTSWTKKAPLEVRYITEQLLPMVNEEAVDASDSDDGKGKDKGDIDNNKQQQIFREAATTLHL